MKGLKSMFESRQIQPSSAAISVVSGSRCLSLTSCGRGGMCDTSVYYVMGQSRSLLFTVED